MSNVKNYVPCFINLYVTYAYIGYNRNGVSLLTGDGGAMALFAQPKIHPPPLNVQNLNCL